MAQRRPKKGKPKTGKVRWVARYYDDAGEQRGKSSTRRKPPSPSSRPTQSPSVAAPT